MLGRSCHFSLWRDWSPTEFQGMQRKVQTTGRAVQKRHLHLAAIICRNRVLLYGVITLQVDLLSILLCYLSFSDDCSETGIVTPSPLRTQSFSVEDYFRCSVRDDGTASNSGLHDSEDG